MVRDALTDSHNAHRDGREGTVIQNKGTLIKNAKCGHGFYDRFVAPFLEAFFFGGGGRGGHKRRVTA